jgi:hypothetical protein
MDALERLTAIEAIKQLKARYLIAIDAKDWDTYAGVFAPDGLLDLDIEKEYHRGRAIDPGPDGPPWVARGRAQIHDFIAAAHAESVSVHEGHTPIIEITGEDTAEGTWAFTTTSSSPTAAASAATATTTKRTAGSTASGSSSRWP